MTNPHTPPTVLFSQGLVRGVEVSLGPTPMPTDVREVMIDMTVQTPQGPIVTRIQVVITQQSLEQLVRSLRRVKNEGGHEAEVDA